MPTTTDCVFCDVVAGEAPANRVAETDDTLAFAPLTPDWRGHLLVIPTEHYESLFDVPESTLATVTGRAKDIAERLRSAGYDGVNLLHASGPAAQQSVPHFHLHLVPRRADDGYDLWPETDRWDGTNDAPAYDDIRSILD